MTNEIMPRILTRKDIFTDNDYPSAIEFAKIQTHINWSPDEIDMTKDLQDLYTKLTPSELFGVTEILKLFTLYELNVGSDYWGGYVAKNFPRPEIRRMASVFSTIELNVHAPFYNKVNELMGLDTDEFYNSYQEDEVLSNRMKWIAKRVSKSETTIDKLKSVAIFSMIEGVILFSAFAFLKHFNSNGKNKLSNLNAGINFSVSDEDCHSKAGAWLYRTLRDEAYTLKLIDDRDIIELNFDLRETAKLIFEHESIIIKKIFASGIIDGITETQLIHFIESRLDICLEELKVGSLFRPKYNPIATWFYNDLNSSILHDFFVSNGNDYSRNWVATKFTW